jgi:hypothetical protein
MADLYTACFKGRRFTIKVERDCTARAEVLSLHSGSSPPRSQNSGSPQLQPLSSHGKDLQCDPTSCHAQYTSSRAHVTSELSR